MIVYENIVNTFIEQCNNETIGDLILAKCIMNGFSVSESEVNSWNNSLPFVASVLDHPKIDPNINIAVEYNFNVNKARMDVLIFGLDEKKKKNVVIIELKQWSEARSSNVPNHVYTYIGKNYRDLEHPSYQAYRYKHILTGFNEFVQDNAVNISSCSYLHNMEDIHHFVMSDKGKFGFIKDSPVFLKGEEEKLRDFVSRNVKKNHRILLYEIDNSRIRPSKDFSNLMYNALRGEPIFSLDDEQANSVTTIVQQTKYALDTNQRRTIIIKGGPGTGKSIVAINALGQLLHPSDGSAPNNAVYCTTNYTPRAYYSETLIGHDYRQAAISELFKPIASFSRSRQFEYDCILLDEAHRAFDWKFGQGVKREVDLIDRLFYASRVNVFFIDENQVVTKDDYLTIDKIKEYAARYRSLVVEASNLELSTQFRVLGGHSYIAFINSFLGYDDKKPKYKANNSYDFQVFDSPTKMWEALQAKQAEYPLSRLLAGYTHDWVSQHEEDKYDFNLEGGKFKMKWNKKTPLSYIKDETQFDRIGSIHTIQGVDMDYAGVIIGKDLIYRNGKILFDQSANAATDRASGIRSATPEDAERMIRNTYKVLLTRAIYGTYIYCEDKALNDYLKTLIN